MPRAVPNKTENIPSIRKAVRRRSWKAVGRSDVRIRQKVACH